MTDLQQQVVDTGKDIFHETLETVGEQIGVKHEKGKNQGVKEQFNFWEEVKEQLFSNKSPEQIQLDAQKAHSGEKFKSPEKLAEARKRLQELNTPAAPSRPYEYRGPEVPTQNDNTTIQFEGTGPQVPQSPQQQTPSSLNFSKQGSNEMLKKMVG